MRTNDELTQAGASERRHYVHYVRPRCVVCGSLRLRSYRTVPNGDGSLTRYSACQDCGAKLFVVAE